MDEIIARSKNVSLVFPVHPRIAKILENMGISHPRLHMIEPFGYLEFNYLVDNSMAVITNSGGITVETTVIGMPCITLRDNTERPETITLGTNVLIGTDPKVVVPAIEKLFRVKWEKGSIPKLWDGKTSKRIVEIITSGIVK